MSRAGLSVVLITTTIGCADPSPGYDQTSEAPSFDGVVDLQVGKLDGDDAYVFGSIAGIVTDSSGRVFVADFQAHDVRVFDADGVFQFAFGSEGNGPEDFLRPCCLGWGPDGLLWVNDTGNRRYSGFAISDNGARFEETIRSRHGGAQEFQPVTFDEQGRLVDVGARPTEGGEFDIVRIHLSRTPDADSTQLIQSPSAEAVGLHSVSRGQGRFFLWQPYGPRHVVAHGMGGRWARALTSEYRVEVHREGGEVITITGPLALGPELTADERERAEAQIAAETSSLGIPRGNVPYGAPERKPPIRSMWFDVAGRLWVERNVVGEFREADVYEGGVSTGSYRWPASVDAERYRWASEVDLLGISRDSLGVQRVARVRFAKRQ